jgi:hypothetical protein
MVILYSYVIAGSEAWTVFARSNDGIVGPNPTQGIDVCVFILFVFFCVLAAALRRADPPSKESYRLCTGVGNWKSGQGPHRAVDGWVGGLVDGRYGMGWLGG